MTLTIMDLTAAEATAVYRASEAMREWRDRYSTTVGDRVRCQTGTDTKVTGPKPSPCQPIVELHKRGEIDGARDAQLTALAYRMSLNGEGA